MGRAVPLESGEYGTSEGPGDTQWHTPIQTVTEVTESASDGLSAPSIKPYHWFKHYYSKLWISLVQWPLQYRKYFVPEGKARLSSIFPYPLKLRKFVVNCTTTLLKVLFKDGIVFAHPHHRSSHYVKVYCCSPRSYFGCECVVKRPREDLVHDSLWLDVNK